MHVRAYAKLNLMLAVGPPEPEGSPRAGYHPIRSIMRCVDLWDGVEIEADGEAPRLEVVWASDAPVRSEIDWPPERDLAVRAVRGLEAAVGRPLGVRIRIEKRIPVGGGLGGGSSDAAAVLMGVRELFDLPIDDAGLLEIGGRLGSDVGFFLDRASPPRPARVEGFGERIERVGGVREGRVLLLMPGFESPTAQVYWMFDRSGARGRMAEARDDACFNDLAEAAMRLRPLLRAARDAAAKALGREVHLTGSGSTLFAFDDGGTDAAALGERLGMAVVGARLC